MSTRGYSYIEVDPKAPETWTAHRSRDRRELQ